MKTMKKFSVIALSALLTLGVSACTTGGETEKSYEDPNEAFTTYDNKAYNEYLLGEEATIKNQWEGYGIGDPFIMRYNGMYYLYCSTLDGSVGIRAYKSADLVNWTSVKCDGLTEGFVSMDPVTTSAYAPEVYYWNGKFYLYISPAGAGHYVLTSDSPEGPFVKATNNFGLSIDGSVFIEDDETMYFTYASDGGIRMAKMTDMLTVDATSTPQLNGTSIGGWTEGPYILKRDGTYYLTYTGNHVTSAGYRIAYATADHLLTSADSLDRNAFTRAAINPLMLETEGDFKGLGHSSTVMGPDMDSYYIAYHTLNSSGGPNRSFALDRITFNGTQMSVSPALEGSITPTLPAFYATGKDEEKFETSGDLLLSKTATEGDFTAEYNLTGSSSATYVFGYTDAQNYCDVTVDLTAKTVKLSKTTAGTATVVATGTLVNDFAADKLHTVRVSARDGKTDVVFDGMTKIDGAELDAPAGKIGYRADAQAQIGYTAFSNVAMGMSDQAEPKQATGFVGASDYLYDDVYAAEAKLSGGSGIATLEEGMFAGVKMMTLSTEGDFANYLVNFREAGRYGLELVYRAEDGGKKIGVKLSDGTVYRCTLPEIESEDGYVKAIVGEFDAAAGITTVRMENVGSEVGYVCFRFTEVSKVTPEYEASLADYAERGTDYQTIWKLKDGGHYAKAGTRQLVYFGDGTLTDFTLEVEIKLEGRTGTSTAGIVFRAGNYAASPYDSYTSMQGYYLAINNNQIVLESLNYADGTQSVGTFVQGNPFAQSDVFIPVKIQVRGNNIKVWSGDTLMIDATDPFGYVNGKVGLYTNGAAAVYRNLKIYE